MYKRQGLEDLVGLQDPLGAVLVRDRDADLGTGVVDGVHPGGGEDVDAQLPVLAGEFGGDLGVLQGRHAVQELDDGDLHTVVVQDVGELDADGTGARDDDRLRQVLGEDLILVGHHPRTALGAGQQLGRGSGGDDAVLEADGPGVAVAAGDLEGVRVEEGAAAVQLGDLVLLHQVVDALDPAVGDLAAAAERLPVVEGHLPVDPDAEGLRLVGEDVRQLGVAQQGLGGDAAHVQAHAAPVPLLDDRDALAQLCGADGGDVAAGPGAEYDDVESLDLLVHARSLFPSDRFPFRGGLFLSVVRGATEINSMWRRSPDEYGRRPYPASRSTAASTGAVPSSARIRTPRARARSRCPGSRTARSRAGARSCAVRARSGTRRGATPRVTSRSAQNPSSNWIGTGTAGTPARSPAAVVPAPA